MTTSFLLRTCQIVGLVLAASLLISCGSSKPPASVVNAAGSVPPVMQEDGSGVVANTQLRLEHGQSAAMYAMGLVGVPYRYGGNTLASGFDCSGLIAHVYQSQTPFSTPRTVAQLNAWGVEVSKEKRRTGDLVFFKPVGMSLPTHAGIYVGQGRFVHAPSTGGTVRLNHTDEPYWSRMQVSYRIP